MKRLIAIVAALAALSGCATFPHAQRPANLYEAAQQIVSSTGAVVARAAHSAGRYGATFGATGGSEVGSFPNAAPLNGSERILADQNATTVNLTPAQIAQYLGIPNGLTFPLSVANGGNGTATPGLVAGSNITITGSWPDQTIASTGGATPGGSSGSIQWNNGGVLAGLSVGAGQILQGGTTPTATSTPTLGASGTLGTLTFGNATSGLETVEPPTGALGTLTITLPGTSGTLALTSGNVATATALAATPTTCSATQAATGILANGNATGCFTPSGSGTVTDGSGTTTANELLLSSATAHAYTNATTLPTSALPALAGDVTSSAGSNSVTVSKVNGASVPASAALTATNSSSQFTAITVGQGLAISSATLGTNAPNRTVTASPTVASTDMGGAIFMNVTGGGALTIPAIGSGVFGNGQTLVVTNYSASTATVTTTPTVNSGGGCVSGTGIPSGDSWQLVSNGTSLDCIQTTPTSSGGGSSAWSALTNPAANLSLSMAGYSTTFDQTSGVNWSWNDTTAATSSTVGDSPIINLGGTYWNGTASASDTWSIQNILGTGTNGTSTLTFSHSGTSGTAAIGVADGANVGKIYQSGTNTYIAPVSGGVLRLTNGSSDAETIINNGGGKEYVDFSGPIGINSVQTTVTGTTAGTAVWSAPQQGTTIKDTVVYLNGYENTTATAQTFALPTAYGTIAYVTTDGGSCTGVTITTGASSTVTLPANMSATQTGLCEIKGY